MGKHSKARPKGRGGKIAVAAATASVIAGWAAPAAYAAPKNSDPNPNPNPVSDPAGAVQKAAQDFGTALTNAASSFTGGTGGSSTNTGIAGLIPDSPFSKVTAQTNTSKPGGSQTAALLPGLPQLPDLNLGSTDAPTLDVPSVNSLVDLPGAPDLNLPDGGLGDLLDLPGGSGLGDLLDLGGLGLPDLIDVGPFGGGLGCFPPMCFGTQGEEAFLGSSLTNGNNLFGLNFFFIGDRNVFVANNSGTGLQFVSAGDDNWFSGNQIIAPTSFGFNLVSMGSNNGDPATLDETTIGDVLAALVSGDLTGILTGLNGATLPELLLGTGSGNNLNAGLFSFGGNTAILGDKNTASGNNGVVGAFNLANNFVNIGDDSDQSGNNAVTGIGSTAFNTAFVGSGSDFSGNNTNDALLTLFGSATNFAFVGNDSDGSGNNFGLFNFALVGDETDLAGNNFGLINIAILPNAESGNCTGPLCINLFGNQLLGDGELPSTLPLGFPTAPQNDP